MYLQNMAVNNVIVKSPWEKYPLGSGPEVEDSVKYLQLALYLSSPWLV